MQEEAGSNVAATLQHRYTELHAAANQLRSLPGAGNVLSCLPDSAEGIIGDGREDEDEDDADRSFSADRSEAIAQVHNMASPLTYPPRRFRTVNPCGASVCLAAPNDV